MLLIVGHALWLRVLAHSAARVRSLHHRLLLTLLKLALVERPEVVCQPVCCLLHAPALDVCYDGTHGCQAVINHEGCDLSE